MDKGRFIKNPKSFLAGQGNKADRTGHFIDADIVSACLSAPIPNTAIEDPHFRMVPCACDYFAGF